VRGPDPRPEGRIRDPDLLRRLHYEWVECVICGVAGIRLSLHHVLKNPRQDVREGLVMLCGDGVQGCHGLIESHDPEAYRALAEHIVNERPDVVAHLERRLDKAAAREWLRRHLQGISKRS
jgi:hypothetical protein